MAAEVSGSTDLAEFCWPIYCSSFTTTQRKLIFNEIFSELLNNISSTNRYESISQDFSCCIISTLSFPPQQQLYRLIFDPTIFIINYYQWCYLIFLTFYQVWSPQSTELLLKLEKPQRRATKYILNLPFTNSVCYKSRLQTLHLLPICYWHEFLDMMHFFKAVNGLISSSFRMHIKTTKCTRSSSNTKRCKIRSPEVQNNNPPKIVLDKIYQNMERTDRHTWPEQVMKNINTFKSAMREYYNTALKNTYDCDDARTFKTICPRCNRARTLTVSVNCCF